MLYAVLLLGLLPLALFSDGSDAEPEEASGDSFADDTAQRPGDLLDEDEDDTPDETDPDAVLQPSDEIDFSDGDGEDPDDVLDPVDVDDDYTPSDGAEGDILDPVDEDDVADALEGHDVNQQDISKVTQIDAFDVTSDVLCLFLDDEPDTLVSAKTSDDGKDTEVYLGPDLVAIVKGVSDPHKLEINTAVDVAA
jgi:hypothetical protein